MSWPPTKLSVVRFGDLVIDCIFSYCCIAGEHARLQETAAVLDAQLSDARYDFLTPSESLSHETRARIGNLERELASTRQQLQLVSDENLLQLADLQSFERKVDGA